MERKVNKVKKPTKSIEMPAPVKVTLNPIGWNPGLRSIIFFLPTTFIIVTPPPPPPYTRSTIINSYSPSSIIVSQMHLFPYS